MELQLRIIQIILQSIQYRNKELLLNLVLFRQLDLKFLKQESKLWNICESFSTTKYPQNELIDVEAKRVVLKEGEIIEKKEFNLVLLTLSSIGVSKEVASRCKFYQADASNLKPIYSEYDLVLALNLLDRLYDPMKFLNDVKSRINSGGIFLIASPYNWNEEFTPKERWLGGYYKDGVEVKTADTLKEILNSDFELIDEFEQEFIIREQERNYQHSLSSVQVWRKW